MSSKKRRLSAVLTGAVVVVMTAVCLSGCSGGWFKKPDKELFDPAALHMTGGLRADVTYTTTGFKMTGKAGPTITTEMPLESSKGGTITFAADVVTNTCVQPITTIYYYTDGKAVFESSPVKVAVADGKVSNKFAAPDGFTVSGMRFCINDTTATAFELKSVDIKEQGKSKNQFSKLLILGDYYTSVYGKTDITKKGFKYTFTGTASVFSNVNLLDLPTRTSVKILPGDTKLSGTGTMTLNLLYSEVDTYVLKTKSYVVKPNTNIIYEPDTGVDFFHIVGFYFSFAGTAAGDTVTFDNFSMIAYSPEAGV